MNTIKKILVLLLTLIILIGVCGCMNTTKNNSNRKESDSEYTELMKNYMEEKYGRTFKEIAHVFPEGGINTEMKLNVVTLEDASGVRCNVKARLGTPYKYFDDYVESYSAAQLENSLEHKVSDIGNARIYLTVSDIDINKIDYSNNNVLSLTLVAGIEHSPSDDDFQKLFDIYKEFEGKGYDNLFFIVGFVKESEEFELAIENYQIHGKANWNDYAGEFYGYLTVKSSGLSFDEFKNCFESSGE